MISLARRTPKSTRRQAPKGMTLMELMVAVAILAGMVLAFNMILSQSQLIVSRTERAMRSNAAALAIAQVIRGDLQSATKTGYLDFTTPNELVFTKAGVCQSVTGSAKGNASLVCYRLVPNTAPDAPDQVLLRLGLVLSEHSGTTSKFPDGDWWDADLADLAKLPASSLVGVPTAPDIAIPATIPDEVMKLWMVLAHSVSNFSIECSVPDQDGIPGPFVAASGTYTSDNQENWPVAMRIRFDLGLGSAARQAMSDPLAPPEDTVKFEVICPVGN